MLLQAGSPTPGVLTLALVGLVFTLVILLILRLARRKRGAAADNSVPQQGRIKAAVKRCPTCGNTYTDNTLNYCLVDGASLEGVGTALPYDAGATIKMNNRGDDNLAPTVRYQPETRGDKDKG